MESKYKKYLSIYANWQKKHHGRLLWSKRISVEHIEMDLCVRGVAFLQLNFWDLADWPHVSWEAFAHHFNLFHDNRVLPSLELE